MGDVEDKDGERGSMVSVEISWPEKKSARRIRRWPARDLGSVVTQVSLRVGGGGGVSTYVRGHIAVCEYSIPRPRRQNITDYRLAGTLPK